MSHSGQFPNEEIKYLLQSKKYVLHLGKYFLLRKLFSNLELSP